MIITTFLIFLPILFLINNSESLEIPDWIKKNAEQLAIQKNIDENQLTYIIENLSNAGIIQNPSPSKSQMYSIPIKGKTTFVNLTGHVNDYGKTGLVSLEILKPDDTKIILHTPILETGSYSTLFQIDDQSQKGTYQVKAEFAGKQTSVTYFYLTDGKNTFKQIPSWTIKIFYWWIENKISDKEFIDSVQYIIDKKFLIVVTNDYNTPKLKVSVEGQHAVRRGTTHTITSHVSYGDHYVEGARVILTIEDYGEDVIQEFEGFTNDHGEFIFSWEIPKKFNDVENLFAYISVTYEDSSITKLFKFQVYCLPGEPNCEIEGN